MTAKISHFDDHSATERDLLEELQRLRSRVDELESANFKESNFFTAISNGLKLGVWEWDEVNDKPIYLSEEFALIFGLEQGSAYHSFKSISGFQQYIYPADLAKYQSHIGFYPNFQQDAKKPHVFDYRIRRPDGQIRHIRELEYGVFGANQEILKTYGAIQDITEYQEAVENQKRSEERFITLFEEAPVGIQEENYSAIKKALDELASRGIYNYEEYLLQNPELLKTLVRKITITEVNQELLRIHEADSREEFLEAEADLDDWWSEEWVQIYASEIDSLYRGANFSESERVDTRLNGEKFETRSIITVVKGYEESWQRVITIHEDITDRKKNEAAIIDAKTQAEEANQAKSDFLSSMSHELRTPLNAIIGFSQLSEYDQSLSKSQLSNSREINRAGKHLLNLVDQILDLSRIEAGELSITREKIDLNPIFDECVSWVGSLAESHAVTIRVDPDLFRNIAVFADAIRIKQVFLNLLTNAIKYNNKNGHVFIVSKAGRDGFLKIGVKDTGKGISLDNLKQLFQPFNRLGAETSTIQGTGIGLVITRQLMESMEGTLEVESEEGRGSTFWTEFELYRPSIEETQGNRRADSIVAEECIDSVESGPRILVAEDNLVNQELMRAQLKLLNYRADFAENGVKALAMWASSQYDILLTDIRMPEMDGFELVKNIRSMDHVPSIAPLIVAISANAMDENISKYDQAGVDDVIPKPVDLNVLKTCLEGWQPPSENRMPDKVDVSVLTSVSTELPRYANAIDINVLKLSVGDNQVVVNELLESFARTLPDLMAEIDNAFSWKNANTVSQNAHKLKSSAKSFGAMALGDCCQFMESAANNLLWTDLETQLPVLREQVEDVQKCIVYLLSGEIGDLNSTDTTESGPALTLKVLIVDDDPIMHRITSIILNDLGIEKVLNAMSGAEGLEHVGKGSEEIDVVICDLNMPGMDGVEFIRHLSELRYQGAVVLSSGEDIRIVRTVEKLAIEHELQVIGILQKPVTPLKVATILESVNQSQEEGTVFLAEIVSVEELAYALDHDQLDTFFQPKVDIRTKAVLGVEALVRWNHPEKGLIRPDAFITLAEDNGLIKQLTDVVAAKALSYGSRLHQLQHNLNIAINISVDTLTSLDWPDRMSALIEEKGLVASEVTLEITESRLMEQLSVALDILSRLSLRRFNLSIDDFGTGYSSMEQLQRIPFSEFKIDRAFVHGASSDASARAILESSVLLGKKLDMKVIAEGVEDDEDWKLVESLGCDQVQGYYICKPLPFNELLPWLDRWKIDNA